MKYQIAREMRNETVPISIFLAFNLSRSSLKSQKKTFIVPIKFLFTFFISSQLLYSARSRFKTDTIHEELVYDVVYDTLREP